MFTFILVIHIIVSLLLIIVVLMQQSQGGMGAMFGGAQDNMFGGSGAGNLMTKITTVLAVVFMITSFSMAMISKSDVKTDSDVPEVPIQPLSAPMENNVPTNDVPTDLNNSGELPSLPQPNSETTQ